MKKEMNNKDAENNTGRLTEQEAPVKNTDNAFVKVGRDGQPEMPEQDNKEKSEEEQDRGSLGNR